MPRSSSDLIWKLSVELTHNNLAGCLVHETISQDTERGAGLNSLNSWI